ncbi:bestrophin family protein [bacterium]|nr:bestrophin family protein [bacterium]
MIEYDNRKFFRLLLTFRGSVVMQLLPRSLFFAALAGVFSYLYVNRHMSWSVDTAPWAIVGLALGLLLVFRTNTSYERYWEGRKLWGGIIVGSRKLGMDTMSYINSDSPDSDALKMKIISYAMAVPFLMKHHLRDSRDLSEVENNIETADRIRLRGAINPPITLLTMIQKFLYQFHLRGAIAPPHLSIIDRNIMELLSSFTSCERIKNTPLPLAYVLHLKRTLSIFCATLPLALVPKFGWWTPAIVFFVAYAFLGIEEIGVEIEDPFGDDPNDLPVDRLADDIRAELQSVSELNEPEELLDRV